MPWLRRNPKSNADPRLAIILEEAIRGIEGQRGNLDALHARVGTLLAASTIATSFLGGIALSDASEVGWPGITAVVLFVGHVALALYVLWPRAWVFQTRTSVLLDQWVVGLGYDLDKLRRRLATRLGRYADAEGLRLKPLWMAYAVSIAVLGAEILMWLLELGGFDRLIADVLCGCG